MKTPLRSTLLTLALLSQLVAAKATAETLVVSASAARVRAGPNQHTDHVATIPNGTSVEVYGAEGNWLKVKVNGQNAYMHRSLFGSGQSSSQSGASSAPSSSSTSTLKVSASAARVRATPGGEHIATLRQGTDVAVLGSQGDWYQVRVNGRTAYMHHSVLNGDGTAVVQVGAANFRSAPGMGSRVTQVLKQGARVEVLSVEGEWAKVRAGGQVGYIHQGLIRCNTNVQSGNIGQIRQIAEHINSQNSPSAGSPSSWISPVSNRACQVSPTRGFGRLMHPIHRVMKDHHGQDIRAYSGTPLVAPMDGVVTFAGSAGGYGKQVKIRIGNYEISYSHMNAITRGLRPGSRVPAGFQVGTVGNTGQSTGAHLHMELFRNGNRIDPMSVFSSQQLCRGHK